MSRIYYTINNKMTINTITDLIKNNGNIYLYIVEKFVGIEPNAYICNVKKIITRNYRKLVKLKSF